MSQNGPPMQASSNNAESYAATGHVAAGWEPTMSMRAIVAEFDAFSTDDARHLINAALVICKGKK